MRQGREGWWEAAASKVSCRQGMQSAADMVLLSKKLGHGHGVTSIFL